MISLLPFLFSLWMASQENGSLSANGGASTTLGLHLLQPQEMGDRTDVRMGADRPRPISAWFDDPFAHVGPLDILHIAPFNSIVLMMSSSRPRWRVFSHEVRSFTLSSSGMFLCNTLILATFRRDFIMLSNTNETHHLLL
jgi:hypothetical protein